MRTRFDCVEGGGEVCEGWIGEDVKANGSDLFEGGNSAFVWPMWGNQPSKVAIVVLRAKDQTRGLPKIMKSQRPIQNNAVEKVSLNK
jgi:hypothetical protein